MRDNIATFQIFEIIRIDLTFNSKRFIYSSRPCISNVHENMTFIIGKLNCVSNQLLKVFRLDPRSPWTPRGVL